MTTLQLPDRLAAAILRDAKAFGYATPTAYLKDVVKTDEQRRAGEQFAKMIADAKRGGRIRADEAFWADLRGSVAKTVAAKKAKKA